VQPIETAEFERWVRRLNRRAFVGNAFDAAAAGLAVCLCVWCTAVAFGIDILSPAWLAGTLAPGLIAAFWRGYTRRQTPYRLLQKVDRALDLNDLLSTAYYFHCIARNSQHPFAQAVCREASARVRSIPPSQALPWVVPRSLLACAALLVLLLMLGVHRYGHLESLELGTPSLLARAAPGTLKEIVAQAQREALERMSPPEQQVSPAEAKHWDGPADESFDADGPQPLELSIPASQTPATAPLPSSALAQAPAKDAAEAAARDHDARSLSGQRNGQSDSSRDRHQQPESRGRNESESDLLRKLQDAFAKLLAKLNLPVPQELGRRPGPGDRGTEQEGTGPGSLDETSDSAPAKQAYSRLTVGQERAEASQLVRGAQRRQSSETDEAAETEAGRSNTGIGKRDGVKDLQQARELEAVGRLEEIIGKRAQGLHGEVMVEVSSAQPGSDTLYQASPRQSRPSWGSISREHVPLELQPYIERYFQRIHELEQASEASRRR